jgi:hypothetical protein
VLLGEYGAAGSRQEYARVIAEWEANDRRVGEQAHGAELTPHAWCYGSMLFLHRARAQDAQ